jgi:2-C-methyl-D-erythritol 4-phosphate cytidylyltransferase
MHVTAIIAAAGAGRRLGGPKPKQLLDIGGGSMLQHSVRAFAGHPRVSDIVLVLPKEQTAFALVADEGTDPARLASIRMVAGGERRQDSVANGFDAVDPRSDVVLVHDAARPFVTADLINRTIDATARYGAAIAALPSRDTVKQVDAAGAITGTIPREATWRRRRRASGATCSRRRLPRRARASKPPTKRRSPSARATRCTSSRGIPAT